MRAVHRRIVASDGRARLGLDVYVHRLEEVHRRLRRGDGRAGRAELHRRRGRERPRGAGRHRRGARPPGHPPIPGALRHPETPAISSGRRRPSWSCPPTRSWRSPARPWRSSAEREARRRLGAGDRAGGGPCWQTPAPWPRPEPSNPPTSAPWPQGCASKGWPRRRTGRCCWSRSPGTLSRVAERTVSVVAEAAAAPTAPPSGPTAPRMRNNGGRFDWHERLGCCSPVHHRRAGTAAPLQRVDLATGEVTTLPTESGGVPLRAPTTWCSTRTGASARPRRAPGAHLRPQWLQLVPPTAAMPASHVAPRRPQRHRPVPRRRPRSRRRDPHRAPARVGRDRSGPGRHPGPGGRPRRPPAGRSGKARCSTRWPSTARAGCASPRSGPARASPRLSSPDGGQVEYTPLPDPLTTNIWPRRPHRLRHLPARASWSPSTGSSAPAAPLPSLPRRPAVADRGVGASKSTREATPWTSRR